MEKEAQEITIVLKAVSSLFNSMKALNISIIMKITLSAIFVQVNTSMKVQQELRFIK